MSAVGLGSERGDNSGTNRRQWFRTKCSQEPGNSLFLFAVPVHSR